MSAAPSVRMTRVAALAALALAACNTQGPAGPAGPAGPQGAPGGPGNPSLSQVEPRRATIGTTSEIALAGYGTSWSAAATVSFGAGVTVKKVTAPSATALVVTITVTEGAAAGPRDVTVTEGSSTVTFKGFSVVPYFELTVQGTQKQGSLLSFHARVNDPEFNWSSNHPDLTWSGGSDGLGASDGVDLALGTSYGAQSIDGYLGIDVDAAAGKRTLLVTLNAGTPLERTFNFVDLLDIAERTPPELYAEGGAPATTSVTLANQYDSEVLHITGTDFSGTATGHWVEAIAAGPGRAKTALLHSAKWYSNDEPNFASTRYFFPTYADYYLVVYAVDGPAGLVQLRTDAPTEQAESESNSTEAMANSVASLPAGVTGELAAGEEDWFKVHFGAADVGRSLGVVLEATAGSKFDGIVLIHGPGINVSRDRGFSSTIPLESASSGTVTEESDMYIGVKGYKSSDTGTYKLVMYVE